MKRYRVGGKREETATWLQLILHESLLTKLSVSDLGPPEQLLRNDSSWEIRLVRTHETEEEPLSLWPSQGSKTKRTTELDF